MPLKHFRHLASLYCTGDYFLTLWKMHFQQYKDIVSYMVSAGQIGQGGEKSGSKQKGVMQWTRLELKAKLKWRQVLNKTARLGS